MEYGQLRNYFAGVGVKRLSAVDAEPSRSNQHEIGTTSLMRDQFLGKVQRKQFSVVYVWLGQEQDGLAIKGEATHYDARENQPHRSAEWRLYYPSNEVTEAMGEGDTLFLAMHRDELLYFIIAPEGSTSERQLSWLFGLSPRGKSFESRQLTGNEPELDFAARLILDEIGVEFEEPEAERFDGIIERFGETFPKTAEFSDLARSTLPEVRVRDDPDEALVAWLSREEALFRRLERRIIGSRLHEGFVCQGEADVDVFIKFSLSVQNRRKARMGQSLENHLEAVFQAYGIKYVRGAVTESNHKPDFLFPSAEAYQSAPATGFGCLTMLGVKSTCKDRWRQVLTEAAKIPRKHLLTLEMGISEMQTSQMEESNLQLVVPQSIQASYTKNQQAWLWNLRKLIEDVKTRTCR